MVEFMGIISIFMPGFCGVATRWAVHFRAGPHWSRPRSGFVVFGGFQVLRPADDLLLGRLIAERRCETAAVRGGNSARFRRDWSPFFQRVRLDDTGDAQDAALGSLRTTFHVGIAVAMLAVAVHPTMAVAAAYWGGYLACRVLITWCMFGVFGLKQRTLWKKMPLIPVVDGDGFFCCLGNEFCRRVDSLVRC